MNSKKTVALIISTYRQNDYLLKIFNFLEYSSMMPDHIIIAEDDHQFETKNTIQLIQNKFKNLKISHIYQENIGFRKSTITNKAVAISQEDILIFLDGDCLPHRHYIREYVLSSQLGVFLYSRPVWINPKLIKNNYIKNFSLWNLIKNKSRSTERALFLPWLKARAKLNRHMNVGSWSCYRQDFIEINGFDERFNLGGYGHEDTDLSLRMRRKGMQELSLVNRVIYYHIGIPGKGDHKIMSENHPNVLLLAENNKNQVIRCELGISQWL